MIRKSLPSGCDPMGGHRFSLSQQTRKRVCAETMLKQKSEKRDDDSKKSHLALAAAGPQRFG
jgi:hypothetical protein